MRGITFSIEATLTVLVMITIASFFIFSSNAPNNFATYKTIAMDVANLAASTNYWGEPLYYQQTATKWGQMTSLCITLKQNENTIKSENCGKLSETNIITTERVYFDQHTGQMSVFTVGISPPG